MGLVSKINYFQLGRRKRLCQLLTGSWRLWKAVTFFIVFPCLPFSLYSWGYREQTNHVLLWVEGGAHSNCAEKSLCCHICNNIFNYSTLPIAWWVRGNLLPLRSELTLCRCLYIYISNISCAARFRPVLSSPVCLALCNPSETISFKGSTIWN